MMNYQHQQSHQHQQPQNGSRPIAQSSSSQQQQQQQQSSSSQSQSSQQHHHRSSTSGHHSSSSSGNHRPSSSSQSSSSHKRPSTSISTSQPTPLDGGTQSEFSCSLRYQNNLPDVPFEPKFIQIQCDFTKFTQYKPTSLERNYKQQLMTDPHMGIPIDLIDLSAYQQKSGTNGHALAHEDSQLLKPLDHVEGSGSNGASTNGGGSNIDSNGLRKKVTRASIRPSVAWLRRTEYLSTNDTALGRPQKRQSTGANNQLAIIPAVTVEDDTNIVENTFYSIKNVEQLVHPSGRTDIKPVSVLPVFPDFEMWHNDYTEVNFDTDPLDVPPPMLRGQEFTNYITRQQEIRSKGVIKGITDKFVYFIAPKNELDEELSNNNNSNIEPSDDKGDYKMYKVFTNDIFSQENNENYFMVVKDDGVYYNRLNTKVNLKRVKSRDDKMLEKRTIGRPEFVTYSTRELTEEEIQDNESKLNDLLQEKKAPFASITQ